LGTLLLPDKLSLEHIQYRRSHTDVSLMTILGPIEVIVCPFMVRRSLQLLVYQDDVVLEIHTIPSQTEHFTLSKTGKQDKGSASMAIYFSVYYGRQCLSLAPFKVSKSALA
jgi:hypothetical protein